MPLLAELLAHSRIDSDKHYMTDVLAGALAGTVHGYLTYRWGYRDKRADSLPTVSAARGGLVFEWSF